MASNEESVTKRFEECHNELIDSIKLTESPENEITFKDLEIESFNTTKDLNAKLIKEIGFLPNHFVYVIYDEKSSPIESLKKYKKSLSNKKHTTKTSKHDQESKCLYVGKSLDNKIVKRIKDHKNKNNKSTTWGLKLGGWYKKDLSNIMIRLYYFKKSSEYINEIIYLEACAHDKYKPMFGRK